MKGIWRFAAAVPPEKVKIEGLSARPYKFRFSTTKGRTYVVESSADLRNWSKVRQFTGANRWVTYAENRDLQSSRQFYRVRID